MKTKYSLISLVAFIALSTTTYAQTNMQSDSISLRPDVPKTIVEYRPLVMAGGVIVPMMVYDFMHFHQDASIRRMRFHYADNYKSGWDDYTQFVPLATTWGLRIAGIEGRSQSHWEAVSAQALSCGIGLGITYAGKYVTKRHRPDGSNAMSFPSGHSMMAFAGATILDAEYGDRFPWLSTLGYATATATGVGRILNNKHYATDVVAGAGIGIAATYLGYFLNDLLWGRHFDHFTLSEERSNTQSPAFIKMSKGRQSLLNGIGEYASSNNGNVLSIEARYPIYKQIGVRLGGKMWDSFNTESAKGVNGYALLAGADFMQGIWGGRLWVDAGIATGYHSSINLGIGSNSQRRSQTKAVADAGLPVILNAGISFITTDRLAVNFNADYTFLPKANLKGYGLSMGMSYLLNL